MQSGNLMVTDVLASTLLPDRLQTGLESTQHLVSLIVTLRFIQHHSRIQQCFSRLSLEDSSLPS